MCVCFCLLCSSCEFLSLTVSFHSVALRAVYRADVNIAPPHSLQVVRQTSDAQGEQREDRVEAGWGGFMVVLREV